MAVFYKTIVSFRDGSIPGGGDLPIAFVSNDGGKTFAPVNPSGAIPQDSFGTLVADGLGNIVGGEGSIYVSNDRGATFGVTLSDGATLHPFFYGDTQNPGAACFTPSGRLVIVGLDYKNPSPDFTHFNGVVRYADPPYNSWTIVALNDGIELSGVACSPSGTLVAGSYGGAGAYGTVDGKLYQSVDNGATWQTVFTGNHAVTFSHFNYVLHNGSYFIALGQDGSSTNAQVYKSTTGNVGSWTAHDMPTNFATSQFIYQRVVDWDPVSAKWYAASWAANQVWSSTDGQDFSTLAIDNSVGPHADDFYFGILPIAGTVYVQGTYENTIAPNGYVFYRLDPGPVWTRIQLANTVHPRFRTGQGSGLVGDSNRLCFGTADGFWYYSDDGGNTWTLSVDSMPAGSFASVIVEAAPSNMPIEAPCVDFEIQSPGDMPDSGQQFTGQRLLLTLNTAVEGLVPQLVTPILIIDGVEHTLPPVSANGRKTLDIPIYGYHGRFFDGVRLVGCFTGDRVEVFRVESDVWLPH